MCCDVMEAPAQVGFFSCSVGCFNDVSNLYHENWMKIDENVEMIQFEESFFFQLDWNKQLVHLYCSCSYGPLIFQQHQYV